MQNSFMLGVSVGESFAEYCVLDGSKTLSAKRAYLSRENLKNSLQQFVSTYKDKQITKAFVSLRISEKLLDYQLSGAVAHITTEGFEHWLKLRGCAGAALTSEEMHFSLRERIQADGKVVTALATEELEAIAAKLHMMGTKKVCLHLIHASINPAHEKAAADYLISQGLEVFLPEKTENQDEITRWRKNALNATISGLFAEIKKDLSEALNGCVASSDIYFINSEGRVFQNETNKGIDSLFASYTALGLQYADKNCDVLHLGLENFILISPQKWNETWQSPWGAVENRTIAIKPLSIQPTFGIELNALKHFDFNKQNEGWEPGPMSLGRGQKPMMIDLWSDNSKLTKVEGLQDRLIAAGVQKFKNALFTLSKVSSSRDKEIGTVIKELQSLAIQKVAMEALLFRNNKKITVTGPLADLFANGFKKDPNCSVASEEFSEARAVVVVGQKALKV